MRRYPDIVAGVSIGAFNGAVIAGNPKNPSAALEAFWHDLEVVTPGIPDESLRRLLSSWNSLIFGSPKFFRPNWFTPTWGGPPITGPMDKLLRSFACARTAREIREFQSIGVESNPFDRQCRKRRDSPA
jgi:hypothetical protein